MGSFKKLNKAITLSTFIRSGRWNKTTVGSQMGHNGQKEIKFINYNDLGSFYDIAQFFHSWK